MNNDSLPGILADAGIRLKSMAPGHTEHLTCPRCHGGTSKEKSLSVTVDADGMGVAWVCHRGTCGHKDGARVSSASTYVPRYDPPRPIVKPTPAPKEAQEYRPDWFNAFFDERKIGDRTVKAFGIYAGNVWFPQLEGKRDAVVFPFVWKGELCNRKYRTRPPEKTFAQDKDSLPTLFNIDRLGGAPAEITFVEGEMDVLALFECGIENAVTIKDGAPKEATFKDGDKRFEALRTHEELLSKAKRIVLAGDMDGPGMALREELARRLGRHRCHLVTWPDDCKDACDVLRVHGPDAVKLAIMTAQPYPIAGLQRIKTGTLLALRHSSPPGTMGTGALATDRILKLPTEGRLIVVTGIPGNGKTTWARFAMVHTAANNDRRWAVFSPEMQPWEQFAAECAEVFMGKPFWPKMGPNGMISGMTDPEVLDAERWLSNRVTMLVCDAEDEAPTLDWILERARSAVLRDGVTDLVIDPWNEIDHERGTMSETDYIGRGLQRLKAFGLRHGCNVWIIAHPAKPPPLKPGEKRPAPGPYDISGCYSADTEVLTRRGWVPHPKVTMDDHVCCFDPAEEVLTYQRPSKVHVYDHNGPMHHYAGYSLDLMVTPNHRMLLQAGWKRPGKSEGNEKLGRPDTWSHDGWQFAQSQDLKNAKYRMPMAAPLAAPALPISIPGVTDQRAAWAFVGWFVSEGWTTMKAPAVCQAEAVSGDIRSVVAGLGLPFSEAVDIPRRTHEQPMWRARIKRRGSEAFCDWIIRECGEGAANKRLPASVWQLDREMKQVVFDALISGDGHQRPHNPDRIRQGGCVYATVSKQLADDVQRLAIELGRYASANRYPPAKQHHHDRYQVTIGHPDRTERVIVIPRNRAAVDYAGKVYCLTVPTGAYITRRNGIMAICGNSAHWANKTDLGLTIHSPDPGTSELHIWKTRFRRWGLRGSIAKMDFDEVTGRFSTPAYEASPQPSTWSRAGAQL